MHQRTLSLCGTGIGLVAASLFWSVVAGGAATGLTHPSRRGAFPGRRPTRWGDPCRWPAIGECPRPGPTDTSACSTSSGTTTRAASRRPGAGLTTSRGSWPGTRCAPTSRLAALGPAGDVSLLGRAALRLLLLRRPLGPAQTCPAPSAAGIDVLIFDTTNAVTYPEVYRQLCAVFEDVRKSGGRTPRIAFMVNTQAGKTADADLQGPLSSPGCIATSGSPGRASRC